MSISLIKVLSCSIFIAEKHNNMILASLLKDHTKTCVNKTQFIFILMLVLCYKKHNIYENNMSFQLLDRYIYIYGNQLFLHFLYN